jgi:hypothetical protein
LIKYFRRTVLLPLQTNRLKLVSTCENPPLFFFSELLSILFSKDYFVDPARVWILISNANTHRQAWYRMLIILCIQRKMEEDIYFWLAVYTVLHGEFCSCINLHLIRSHHPTYYEWNLYFICSLAWYRLCLISR